MVKPMKWTAYIKEKVGFSPRHPTSSSSFSSSTSSRSPFSVSPTFPAPVSTRHDGEDAMPSASAPRERDDPESEFKMLWEEFLTSKFEKEKEMALKMVLDIFVRIAKERANGVDLLVRLVEAHVFSFAIGRAFVTHFEKLRVQSKTKTLHASNAMNFFSAATKGGISHGLNLLYAVEVLVSGVVDKQPLLDSGILCCLIHILKGLLDCDETDRRHPIKEELVQPESAHDDDITQVRQIEVEGIIVHIIKALISHISAGACLIEDDSLQILFQIVANGSMTVFSRYKKGLALVPLHTFQLYRHAMQILQLLLVNNNGCIAKYISNHHLDLETERKFHV